MSRSASSSATTQEITGSGGANPLCRCAKQTSLAVSWTDDNPGRRFYRCGEHGFVCWADKEPQMMWQKECMGHIYFQKNVTYATV
ncbi:unnamed protein product [Eruca vesicaria subsp. sativa]|uniref:Zinc finger GRF-type domain-containing protein n=1 Tax=Eruca vesicaria subsp. sativa TaxID=29727 RepID=A0ABC8J1A7_ERUVS|nr:unnamed protein product [Eruca vesicaria subsp. sativa]